MLTYACSRCTDLKRDTSSNSDQTAGLVPLPRVTQPLCHFEEFQGPTSSSVLRNTTIRSDWGGLIFTSTNPIPLGRLDVMIKEKVRGERWNHELQVEIEDIEGSEVEWASEYFGYAEAPPPICAVNAHDMGVDSESYSDILAGSLVMSGTKIRSFIQNRV